MSKYKKQVSGSKAELQEEVNQLHTKDVQAHRSTLRNFFGQRPPSELISSNLAEYFPDTRQKIWNKPLETLLDIVLDYLEDLIYQLGHFLQAYILSTRDNLF